MDIPVEVSFLGKRVLYIAMLAFGFSWKGRRIKNGNGGVGIL